jgi:hypothetical protein
MDWVKTLNYSEFPEDMLAATRSEDILAAKPEENRPKPKKSSLRRRDPFFSEPP